MIAEAKTNLAELAKQLDFNVFDAQMIPYSDESFEIVIANHMLYHVPDISKALAGIRRVLTPDGCLFAATNGVSHMQEFHDLIRIFDSDYFGFSQSFTLENGRDILKSHFEDVNLLRYENSLIVTEVMPLFDYLLSTINLNELDEEQIRQIEYLKSSIATEAIPLIDYVHSMVNLSELDEDQIRHIKYLSNEFKSTGLRRRKQAPLKKC